MLVQIYYMLVYNDQIHLLYDHTINIYDPDPDQAILLYNRTSIYDHNVYWQLVTAINVSNI